MRSVVIDDTHFFFFFQAEDGIRDLTVTGVQTCALPIYTLIPLARTPEAFYVGTLADERVLKDRFYLGVQAQVPVGRLTEEIPAKTKIKIGRASCRERV